MNFIWYDYNPNTMSFVENWLDESAINSTGLDEGFRAFYEYWSKEDGLIPGENFWCKVTFEEDTPFAVIAFCQHEHKKHDSRDACGGSISALCSITKATHPGWPFHIA